MRLRPELFFIGLAFAACAYVVLNAWSERNAPPWRRLELAWAADVALMEASGRLPAAWYDVAEIEVSGGTPETRGDLRRIKVPIKIKPNGKHRLDVLLVVWREGQKRGALVQYDLENIKTKNTDHEINRTLNLTLNVPEWASWAFR